MLKYACTAHEAHDLGGLGHTPQLSSESEVDIIWEGGYVAPT